jgi:hypothetical protein
MGSGNFPSKTLAAISRNSRRFCSDSALRAVANRASIVAPQSGILELSIHDLCLADNAGSLFVTVEEGLDAQGALNRYIADAVNSLTPHERNRLSILVINSNMCSEAQQNAYSLDCIRIVLGFLSLFTLP